MNVPSPTHTKVAYIPRLVGSTPLDPLTLKLL